MASAVPRRRNAALCCRPPEAVMSTLRFAANNDLLLDAHEAPPPHCWLPSDQGHASDQATHSTAAYCE